MKFAETIPNKKLAQFIHYIQDSSAGIYSNLDWFIPESNTPTPLGRIMYKFYVLFIAFS